MDYTKLADLLLPRINQTPEDILPMYPKRRLADDAKVTRYAPSPTGFLHMGALFASFVSERLAHQSGGIFYLRIEDTDKKREIQGSIPGIIEALDYFGTQYDEGEIKSGSEIGNYGPYRQSARKSIYQVFVKELIKKGLAYPCFCSAESLNGIRSLQKAEKQLTGYYGKWSVCRNRSMDEIIEGISNGKPYVIRFKSPGNPDGRIAYKDLVKGVIEFPENIQDIVILKSDGLPTYHFAHIVDDYLMGTTHVIRADEWLSSVPVHLQLFNAMGWKTPFYGHISPIMKMDGTSKRKFSKRKDPEFAVSWYQQQGYPGCAVVEYLLGLMNSNYEEWRLQNPHEPYNAFKVTIEKMSGSGALFDINKFNDVCRNVISTFTAEEVYSSLTEWSSRYDSEFHKLITQHKEYTIKILGIDRRSDKPRKDFAKCSDIKPFIGYFYDELFDINFDQRSLPPAVSAADAAAILQAYMDIYSGDDDKSVWFEKIKGLCDTLGYAGDMKAFKKNPSAFKGSVSDLTMVLRVALTGRTNTPDLYEIMQIMGTSRVLERFQRYLY